jgi:hypothetical protein
MANTSDSQIRALPAGSRLKNGLLPSLALLFLVICIVWGRRPELLTSPRFWAEEGELYFLAAFNSGFWHALFLQHAGYYDVIPNAATALAALVPLEHAPFVTTNIAFLFQVLVSAVVVFGDSPYWNSWPKKLIIASGIQLINPPEVWLTTISVHFWLCIATFFILLENPYGTGRLRRNFHRGMLAMAGISSVLSIFLTPLFLWKAWRSKLHESWVQSAILTTALLVQLFALASYLFSHDSLPTGSRLGVNHFSLPQVFAFHFFKPFFEWESTRRLPLVILIVAALSLALFSLYLLVRSIRNGRYLTLFLAFLLVTFFSTMLSINMTSSPRYAFAPSAMILVALVNEMFQQRNNFSRWLAAAFVAVILVCSSTGFRSRVYYSPIFPRWQQEVMEWHQDPSDPLLIWPQFQDKSWRIILTPPNKGLSP